MLLPPNVLHYLLPRCLPLPLFIVWVTIHLTIVNWKFLEEKIKLIKRICELEGEVRTAKDITYWDKPEWLAAKNRQGSILGPGTKVKKSTVLYIQHANGSYATPHELEEMCSFARSIWSQFVLVGVAPTTWTKLDNVSQHYYYREMRIKFPALRYCSANWKPDQLAIDSYSQWSGRPHEVDDSDVIKKETTDPPVKLEQLATSLVTKQLEVHVLLVRYHNHSQKAPQAIDDPLSGLTPSLRVNLDTLKQSEIPTELSTSPPSLLLTLQDNISEDLQPTTVPECDSENPVDLVAMVLPAVIVPCASDEVTCTVESTTIESIDSRVLRPNKASKTARNLCALEWCVEMKKQKLKPFTKEFDAYWKKLSKDHLDQIKVRSIGSCYRWL
ncbi:hypothetical protein EDB19DRAFT_1823521 [Suillus lakei]|nr:hypothetical protein EDB19DRAFT_1823521 [Suillus lakei]